MSRILVMIGDAVRLLRDRVLRIENRLLANENAVKSLRIAVGQLKTNMNAQPVAPGSPIQRHLQDFYAKVVSQDEEDERGKTWWVRRQVVTGFGTLEDDEDYPDNVRAKTHQPTELSAGDVVLVRWDGTDQTGDWHAIVSSPGAGGGERKYARITQVEGSSPPYLYSGQQVMPAANGTWEDVSGGDNLSSNLYNIGESVYPGAGKVPVGRVVVYWAGVDCFLFDVLWYRGTYG